MNSKVNYFIIILSNLVVSLIAIDNRLLFTAVQGTQRHISYANCNLVRWNFIRRHISGAPLLLGDFCNRPPPSLRHCPGLFHMSGAPLLLGAFCNRPPPSLRHCPALFLNQVREPNHSRWSLGLGPSVEDTHSLMSINLVCFSWKQNTCMLIMLFCVAFCCRDLLKRTQDLLKSCCERMEISAWLEFELEYRSFDCSS